MEIFGNYSFYGGFRGAKFISRGLIFRVGGKNRK
jgi:hypothetical protein